MSARLAARRAAASRGIGPGSVPGIARLGGRFRGTLSNWNPLQSTRQELPRERSLIARRAEDLAANDPHAASLVGSMAVNIVGTGIKPQSQIDHEALGISEEEAQQVQSQAERAFSIWSSEADAGGRMSFDDIQYLSIWSALALGEYLHLCRMLEKPGRTFKFALRCLSPHRLSTPSDKSMDPALSEGVQLGDEGEPLGYWIQKPDPFTGRLLTGAASGSFVYNQAWMGHRPVVLHGFPVASPESVRGVSVLAPAMKFFRDLSDCLDYNLVAQIITAAFPVAVSRQNGGYQAPGNPNVQPEQHRYQEVSPGSFIYLNDGESIQNLTNANPPNTFAAFVERILRAVGAAAGMPYELVARDFSKTNYSSARAALLEAWRVLNRYTVWLSRVLCQRCWNAVFEEAWLMGMVKLPAGAPDFYEGFHAWTRSMWIPPKRGHVDPLKEMSANIEGLKHGLLTYAEIIESNGGDWETSFSQQGRERGRRSSLGLPMPESNQSAASAPDDPEEKPEESRQEDKAA